MGGIRPADASWMLRCSSKYLAASGEMGRSGEGWLWLGVQHYGLGILLQQFGSVGLE